MDINFLSQIKSMMNRTPARPAVTIAPVKPTLLDSDDSSDSDSDSDSSISSANIQKMINDLHAAPLSKPSENVTNKDDMELSSTPQPKVSTINSKSKSPNAGSKSTDDSSSETDTETDTSSSSSDENDSPSTLPSKSPATTEKTVDQVPALSAAQEPTKPALPSTTSNVKSLPTEELKTDTISKNALTTSASVESTSERSSQTSDDTSSESSDSEPEAEPVVLHNEPQEHGEAVVATAAPVNRLIQIQATPVLDANLEAVGHALKSARSRGLQLWYFTAPESMSSEVIQKLVTSLNFKDTEKPPVSTDAGALKDPAITSHSSSAQTLVCPQPGNVKPQCTPVSIPPKVISRIAPPSLAKKPTPKSRQQPQDNAQPKKESTTATPIEPAKPTISSKTPATVSKVNGIHAAGSSLPIKPPSFASSLKDSKSVKNKSIKGDPVKTPAPKSNGARAAPTPPTTNTITAIAPPVSTKADHSGDSKKRKHIETEESTDASSASEEPAKSLTITPILPPALKLIKPNGMPASKKIKVARPVASTPVPDTPQSLTNKAKETAPKSFRPSGNYSGGKQRFKNNPRKSNISSGTPVPPPNANTPIPAPKKSTLKR